jgi:2-methylcitrate dehydratase PrpD
VLDGWGPPFDIESPGASYKLYPCCYSTHSAVQAALTIVEKHGVIDPATVARIDSKTSDRALMHTDRPRPTTPLEAKFSVQYCVTRALVDGKVMLKHFQDNAFTDRAILALLPKVHAAPYTGPQFSPEDPFDAEVSVTLLDGRVLKAKVDSPRGRGSDDPIPGAALEAKFLDCASRVLDPAAAGKVCRTISTLEGLRSVRELTTLCEVTERNARKRAPSAV